MVEKFNLVSIFFSDIVGFTSMAGEMSPIDVMSMLNQLYTQAYIYIYIYIYIYMELGKVAGSHAVDKVVC